MSSSSPGGGTGRPPIWVVVLGLLVLMARLTEAAQNLRHVLADSDSDPITKTKIKTTTTTTTTTNDLVDTEAAASKLVQEDVAEDTTKPIFSSIAKSAAAKDTTEKNLRRLAESSNNDQYADDEVEPDFMYWVTPIASLGLTCGGSSIKSRDGEYTCIKAGEALCQDNDGGPFGRWTFGITEDNQVNLWTPKNEVAWTFCTEVSHVCIGEERDPRPDKYSNQRPYLYFYDEKTQRTVGNLTCDGTDGLNGENLDKPTILKMVDNSDVGMYANYNISVLKFKKGQTPDLGDSNELFHITIGENANGTFSFSKKKCIWADSCPETQRNQLVHLFTSPLNIDQFNQNRDEAKVLFRDLIWNELSTFDQVPPPSFDDFFETFVTSYFTMPVAEGFPDNLLEEYFEKAIANGPSSRLLSATFSAQNFSRELNSPEAEKMLLEITKCAIVLVLDLLGFGKSTADAATTIILKSNKVTKAVRLLFEGFNGTFNAEFMVDLAKTVLSNITFDEIGKVLDKVGQALAVDLFFECAKYFAGPAGIIRQAIEIGKALLDAAILLKKLNDFYEVILIPVPPSPLPPVTPGPPSSTPPTIITPMPSPEPTCFEFTYYRDVDGDGRGDPAKKIQVCDGGDPPFFAPPGYVWFPFDCDDNNTAVYEDAREIADGIDNNCDGIVDDPPACDPISPTSWCASTELFSSGNEYIVELALSADGSVLAVMFSSQIDDYSANNFIRVFEVADNAYRQIGADITMNNSNNVRLTFHPDRESAIGSDLAISEDGSVIAFIDTSTQPDPNGNPYTFLVVRVLEIASTSSSEQWQPKGDVIQPTVDTEPLAESLYCYRYPTSQFLGFFSAQSISLSGSGNEVAIGYRDQCVVNENTKWRSLYNYNLKAGVARVYKFTDNGWESFGGDILGVHEEDKVGVSVALSADGSTLAVAGEFTLGFTLGENYRFGNRGAIQMYGLSSTGIWIQLGNTQIGFPYGELGRFGLDISDNGRVVAAVHGSIGELLSEPPTTCPATYCGFRMVTVFRFDDSVQDWVQKGNSIQGCPYDGLGGFHALSLSGSGDVVAIGAPGQQYSSTPGKPWHELSAGYTTIHRFNQANSQWESIGFIEGTGVNYRSGSLVAMSADGNVLVEGSYPMRDNALLERKLRLFTSPEAQACAP